MTGLAPDRRAAVLAEGNRLAELALGATRRADPRAAAPLWERWSALRTEYTAALPEPLVARCPMTGVEVRWPIDTVDLDGWFWDYDGPARRDPVPLSTWLAMTGALRLAGPPAPAPFRCLPGPEVPAVIPRILGCPGVVAVVRELPIGPHTGWTVSYFGPRPRFPLANVWAADRYPAAAPTGVWGWAAEPVGGHPLDYDLRPWLDRGRLYWIAPADDAGRLRRGAAGCPYLDLPGRRSPAVIRDGVVLAASA